MLVNNNDARPKIRSPNRGKNWYPGRITVPANLVSRLEIWGARDNGIPSRSTPALWPSECDDYAFCKVCYDSFSIAHVGGNDVTLSVTVLMSHGHIAQLNKL